MALFEVNAEFTRVAHALERIATALESLLRAQFGIDLQPDAPEPPNAPAAEVTYSDDLSTAAMEAHEEAVRLGIKLPSQADDV